MAWVNMTYERDNSWDIEKEICEECPEMEAKDDEATITVILSNKAEMQINALLKEYKEKEWFAGLNGTKNSDKEYFISDLLIVEQEVGMATVELTDKGNEKLAKTKGIIGWIHSHNDMGSFQSGTDVKTACMFDISITVNNDKYF
jgi:proteasome lid subunit RPN8/RPN11